MELEGELLLQPPGNLTAPTFIDVVYFPEIPCVMLVTVRREESMESVGSSLKMLIVCGLYRQTGPQLISKKELLTVVSFKEMVRNRGHPGRDMARLYFDWNEKFHLPHKTSLIKRNKIIILGRSCACAMPRVLRFAD